MSQLKSNSGAKLPAKTEHNPQIRAPHGTPLSCRGWQQEAALRMLLNSFDAEVTNRPNSLGVYGGTHKPARDDEGLQAIIGALQDLRDNETLIVTGGGDLRVLATAIQAPRLLIVNSSIASGSTMVDEFSETDRLGLELFAQMTVGSWIHTGAQGILQGTDQVFAAAAERYFGGDLAGKFVVSGGMGRMGGAQALAATLNGAAFLGIEVHQERIKQCIRLGYCDICVNSLDEAIRILKNAVRKKQGVSVGLVGNCAEIIPELARRGIVPNLLTDQTDAYDLLNGYIPAGLSLESASEQRRTSPDDYLKRCYESISLHVSAMLALQKLGSIAFDFGNNLYAVALERGSAKDARNIPGFFQSYIRPLLDDGCVPVRSVALSGEARDIHLLDAVALELLAHDAIASRWIRQARRVVKFQGLPARICWMRRAEQRKFQERVNHLVAKGELKAPIVMGSTQIELAAVAQSFLKHERESIDNPQVRNDLSELLNANSGAAWISLNQFGNPDIRYSQASGQVVVADGSILPNPL